MIDAIICRLCSSSLLLPLYSYPYYTEIHVKIFQRVPLAKYLAVTYFVVY